jgi:hypothetical protein
MLSLFDAVFALCFCDGFFATPPPVDGNVRLAPLGKGLEMKRRRSLHL